MPDFSVIVGSTGVSILLLAFLLNIFKVLSSDSRTYIGMNVVGAALACYAAVLIRYVPFIVLEAAWCLAALAGLFRPRRS